MQQPSLLSPRRRRAVAAEWGADDGAENSTDRSSVSRGFVSLLLLVAFAILAVTFSSTLLNSSGRHAALQHVAQGRRMAGAVAAAAGGEPGTRRVELEQGDTAALMAAAEADEDDGGDDSQAPSPYVSASSSDDGEDEDEDEEAADEQRHAAGAPSTAGAAPGQAQQQQQQQRTAEDAAAHESEEEAEEEEAEPSPYERLLAECDDFECLRDAAKQKRHPGQRLFPAFFTLSWQRSAEPALLQQLLQHPGVALPGPTTKGGDAFKECGYAPGACAPDMQAHYIQKVLRLPQALEQGLSHAAFDAAPLPAWEGARLAKGLRQALPWVRLVAPVREPIAHALATLADGPDAACLADNTVYNCLKPVVSKLSFAPQLEAWSAAFPPQQLLLVQAEALSSAERGPAASRAVAAFLGLDSSQAGRQADAWWAAPLGEHAGKRRSWPIRREEYHKLMKMVKPEVERLADLAEARVPGSGRAWKKTWEKAWQANLNSCTLQDECTVQLA